MPADRPAQERGEGIRRWTTKAEVCPVCHAANIAGTKYCYGLAPPWHERTRFEFVEVAPVADEQAVRREALREAAEKLRELADGKDDAPIAELRGWKRAARVLDSLASEPAEWSKK